MPRAFVLVLDSVGIGGAPDAAQYGDAGADTVGHIAEACAAGKGDRAGLRSGPLDVPNLAGLGLGSACRLASGRMPPGLATDRLCGRFGCAAETSRGKDTPSGHWEIAGCPVRFDWGYFPNTQPCFPVELIDSLCRAAKLPGTLGHTHASGTDVIAELGGEHMRTGKPICYSSADSVFQIAAHEETFGLARLYEVCVVARRLVDPLNIGRVIARPFVGTSRDDFARTANRRDYAVPPPDPTILDCAEAGGRDIVTVGKIADIFAHRATGRVLKAAGNAALFDRTIEGVETLGDGGILIANFIDFDSLYGHRRDVAGYAAALESWDRRLPELYAELRADDLVIITADHGCDPTYRGTEHTREQIPVLAYGAAAPGSIGPRSSYADIAATVARHLELPWTGPGCAF